MTKFLWMCCLLIFATITSVQAQAPAGSAQWSVDSGVVPLFDFNRLFNSKTGKHLFRKSDGTLDWKTEAPGHGTAFFENCTRPGEVIFGSDRVALRYGTNFLIATGPNGRGWTSDRSIGCQYRLIPSGAGFVPAGSGDRKFAIYNMSINRYLVRTDLLIWKEIGGVPGGVVAAADFVPDGLILTVGPQGNSFANLFIKNIGNVRSSASQKELLIRINGDQKVFLVTQPLAPGARLMQPFSLPGVLPRCVLVELDTRPGLKFQMLPGGLPNDFVFLNDRRKLPARNRHAPPRPPVEIPCEPVVVGAKTN